jgi:choline dehydrogenase
MAYAHTTKGALAKWASDVGDAAYAYENAQRLYRKSTHLWAPPNSLRFANATPQFDFKADGANAGGPLDVSYPNYGQPWATWVAKAMNAVGIPNTASFVNGKLMGSAWMTATINPRNGHRASAATAFATPYLSRPNLRILNSTLAERVLFNAQKKATGVSVSDATANYTVKARKEVILAAGVFQSPQLLLLSGVGPKETLDKYAIPVIANRAGVGRNLNDHVYYGVSYRVNVQTTSSLMYGTTAADAGAQWNTNGTGLLSSPGGDYFGYEKVPASLRTGFAPATAAELKTLPADWPEIQYVSLPAFAGDLESSSAGSPPDGFQYATLLAALVAPSSVGNVTISSSRAKDPPVINPNWMTTQRDIDLVVAGFKRLRQILESPAIKPVTIGPEYYPGAAASVQTDTQILQQVKRSFQTMFHAAATCKMGKSTDQSAVVDSSARVYGVSGREYP